MLPPSVADVMIVITLIVPGFISLAILKRVVIMETPFSDFETTVWSLFISLLIYTIFGVFTGIIGIESLRDNMFSPYNLAIILILSIAVGAIPGGIIKYVFRRHLSPGDSWDLCMGKASEKGAWVIVYTKNGLEYKGQLHWSGKGQVTPREITIRKPKLILRDDTWKVLKEIKMGKEIFFTEEDIQRIVFL